MEPAVLRDPMAEDWIGVRLTNPVTGEQIEVLEIGSDDDGQLLRGRLRVEAGSSGPPRHVHPYHEEWFTVESGELTVHVEGEDHTLSSGETITIPPGSVHGFENRACSPVVFIGAIQPRSRILHVLSTLFGLAHDGEVRDDGTPGFLQAMVFARAMKDDIVLASPPYPVQRLLWTLFAPVGKLLGYRATYDRYLRPDFWEDGDPA